MIGKRPFLILLIILGVIFFTITLVAVGPVEAQRPDGEGGDQASTQEPAATPSPAPTESSNQPSTQEPATTPSPSSAESSDQPAAQDPSAAPSLPPEEDGNLSSELTPSASPLLEVTGTGWVREIPLSPTSDVSILALNPVDCATFTSPVVGYEVSRGQDPDDIADFINDLIANGFSVGTVNISAGPIPSCVDVLIVLGLRQNSSLLSNYTAADGTLLQSWTVSGHGLMLLGDHSTPPSDFRPGTEALFQAYGYSQQGASRVSDPDLADIDPAGPFNSWVIYQIDNFAGHPILNGVASLELLASSALTSSANAIVTADTNANPPNAPVMAAFADGSGCVALSTDSNWVGVAAGGYFKQDNATVARQMVAWLNGCASLSLAKVASPSPVQAGGLLTYTLAAVNNSTIALTNVLITDTVPVSTSFVSASSPFSGPDANGVVTWSLGVLNPNTSATRTMVVQVDSLAPVGSVITNTAWVTSSQGLTDTATTFTPVNVQVVDPLVTKAVNTSQAQVGEVITFTLTVSQTAQSTSNATNVRVVDPLPPEVDILGAPEVNAGFTQVVGRVVTWTIPVLTPADIRFMTLRVQVNTVSPPPLTIRNQATLRFDQGADRPSNQVEVFVPAAAPPSTPTAIPTFTPPPPTRTPAPPSDDDDDQPPPAPPAPATPIAIAQPVATAVLPVAVLPETGSWAIEFTSSWIGLSLALLLVGVIGMLLKFRLR